MLTNQFLFLITFLLVGCSQNIVVGEKSSLREPEHRALSGGFRLKMYWSKDSYWQETHAETKWCLDCRNGCKSGHDIQLRACASGTTKWEFVGSGSVQIKIANSDLCIGLRSSNQTQPELQNCNSGNSGQKFNSGAGSFTGDKFELMIGRGCMANTHHPRDKEILWIHNKCVNPRDPRTRTSYYVKY